jgi:hypothetical protein
MHHEDAPPAQRERRILPVIPDHASRPAGQLQQSVEVSGIIAVNDVHGQGVFLQGPQRIRRHHVAAVEQGFGPSALCVHGRSLQQSAVIVAIRDDGDLHA